MENEGRKRVKLKSPQAAEQGNQHTTLPFWATPRGSSSLLPPAEIKSWTTPTQTNKSLNVRALATSGMTG